MILLLWGGAFAVDLGLTTVGNRQVQAMADTAALDVARYVDIVDTSTTLLGLTPGLGSSTAYLNSKLANADTDNGSNATLSETPGVWLNGVFTPENSKVVVGKITETVYCWDYKPVLPQPCNAIKVTATQTVPQIFAGGQPTVSRSAIATVSPEAGFGIGSYLASVNSQQSAVLTAVLGKTLGSAANVTLVGYQGLANTNVTINQLIAASGTLLTASNVMTTSETGQTWQSIWNAAVANQVAQLNCSSTPTPEPCSASTALSGPGAMDLTQNTQVQLCQLVSINGSTCTSGALSTAALATSLNALQTFTTEAELANGTNAVDLGTSLGITGVSDATLTLTLGQVPQVAFGPLGTTASTAQLTSDLKLNDGVAGIIDIPLSAAQGTATLTTLTCAYNSMTATDIQPTTTTVTGNINVAGVVVGSISVSGLNSTTTSPLGYGPTVVPPTATTAANNTNPKGVGTTTPTLAAGSLVVGTLSGSVLNGVVGPILQAAGVSVGGAEVADLSTNCGSVALVK
jgi:uncharacterized membrane protein